MIIGWCIAAGSQDEMKFGRCFDRRFNKDSKQMQIYCGQEEKLLCFCLERGTGSSQRAGPTSEYHQETSRGSSWSVSRLIHHAVCRQEETRSISLHPSLSHMGTCWIWFIMFQFLKRWHTHTHTAWVKGEAEVLCIIDFSDFKILENKQFVIVLVLAANIDVPCL